MEGRKNSELILELQKKFKEAIQEMVSCLSNDDFCEIKNSSLDVYIYTSRFFCMNDDNLI